ncbi:hypothetical protein [Legionella sp.]|uniref:hypothetical protein n=1 Tax=Legionella sp. TaxID=459 RepID=UPI003C94BBFA
MYSKAVSRLYDIYCSPSKIINGIKGYLLKISAIDIQKTPNVRVVDKKIKNNKVTLKIQIINSRASYTTCLSNVISDYDFIKLCEPMSLIRIGYYSKIEEMNRPLNLGNRVQSQINLFQFISNKFKRKIENRINANDYWYTFIELYMHNNEIKTRLLISESSGIFDVPFLDLIRDKSLLENIYSPDLLRMGYQLCQLEIQKKRNPTFEI